MQIPNRFGIWYSTKYQLISHTRCCEQIFCIEIMMNVLVYGVAYFRDLLLMFDAIVVFVSLVRGL